MIFLLQKSFRAKKQAVTGKKCSPKAWLFFLCHSLDWNQHKDIKNAEKFLVLTCVLCKHMCYGITNYRAKHSPFSFTLGPIETHINVY